MTSVNIQQLLKEAADDSIFVAPAGPYQLEVLSSKTRDTDVMPTYKIVAGPYAGKKVMAGVISLKGNAAGLFFRTMKGFGLEEQWIMAQTDLDAFSKALVGRVVNVELGVRPWQGEDRNEIKIGSVQLVSAPALPAGGVPQAAPAAAPAPAAPAPAAPVAVEAPPAAAPAVAAPVAPVVAPAAEAPVPAAPVAPVAAAPAPAVAAPVATAVPPVAEQPAPVAAPAAPVAAPAAAPAASIPVDDPSF